MMDGYSPSRDYEVAMEKQAQLNLHDSLEGFDRLHCNTADFQKNNNVVSPVSPSSSLECQNAFSSLQMPTCSPKSFVSAVKHPTRPVSAYRDFPVGCGRNAPLITKGECHKSVSATVVAPLIKRDFHTSGAEFGSQKLIFDKIYYPRKRRTAIAKQEKYGKREKEKLLPSGQFFKESHHLSQLSRVKYKSFQTCKVATKTRDVNQLATMVKRDDTYKSGRFTLPRLSTFGNSFNKVARKPHELPLRTVTTSAQLTSTEIVCTVPKILPLKSVETADPLDQNPPTRGKVRETLQLFQVLCRKLIHDEEAGVENSSLNGTRFRADLKAAKILKDNNLYVNMGKQIVGEVPGLEVGDQFHYRIELCIVGLHRQIQAGIDFLKQKNVQVATSIVASGGYEDDLDGGDMLIYTGQGGNNYCGDKRQTEDQKLERGNLALKNSIDLKIPVRVIRGIKQKHSGNEGHKESWKNKVSVLYTYDGLYDVEKYWSDRGASGYSVFKFLLRRQLGQPKLGFELVQFVGKPSKYTIEEGLRIKDISEGKERKAICVVNTRDEENGPPPFVYTTEVLYSSWCQPMPQRGCDCRNGCSDSTKCLCAFKNGGQFPFNFDGAIVFAKPIVYECGPSCSCPPNCYNRVSQRGIRFQLEVFKTDKRGWGVRSADSIPSGSFICEYTGELLSDMEAEKRIDNDEYLFDIGRTSKKDQSRWPGLSSVMPESECSPACDTVEDVGFTIDAAKYGSVGRFINHSCSPNLYAQNVLYDHDDRRLPHLMLFAAENIPPMRELFYHYNYTVDQVYDQNGKIKKKFCYCGSSECTGRMY
ncbi:histone-lysine N-methyltransferase, H3 lysine-9 specific SUVH6 isoform X2 [Cryptomeria japonica]|uniref:histone-lysine N-methyltransferase, H3 lysine-9 specific SUVH6 isoform X2 n=1 Tax=Cryptomeria japonica TaxID=3369 RepID=UPI0027DA921D|nr:histone-lysine N-methyltransferase, H3 lysine-9 specific SUVH6 isoform X2 [Cryptomeria japonica]